MRYKWPRYLIFIIAFMVSIFSFVLMVNSPALAIDGGAGDEQGAHSQKVAGLKSLVCSYCHFPKSGKGERIWEKTPLGAKTKATGVESVCRSCHYPGNAVNALSGFVMGRHEPKGHDFRYGNVLTDTSLLGIGGNHVMAEQVQIDPNLGKLNRSLDLATFPLRDPNNTQKKSAGLSPTARQKGFTCTTCHDPHNQPDKDISGSGDYLRTKKEKAPIISTKRTEFCIQCHQDTPQKKQHGFNVGCEQCHHPHDGYYHLSQQPEIARSILIQRIKPTDFVALPNVPGFSSSKGDEIGQDSSGLCYSCHSSAATAEMQEAGAKPVCGDDSKTPFEHHPMGTRAEIGKSPRAPGLAKAVLNPNGQVTCISCHNGFHRGNNPKFLRYDFSQDQAALCNTCHTNKIAENLGEAGAAHYQLAGQSPNKRGQCMFCHFIHDPEDQGSESKPYLKALLRIKPKNLAWSDQINNSSDHNFEDLCFGCHGSSEIMKGVGKKGARLQPEKYSSHRFSSLPSDKVFPLLPISDGDGENVTDDYGTEKGEIYCGSCHDIHNAANKPYLRGDASPYLGDDFCAGCHTKSPAGGLSTHPTGVHPKSGVTNEEFPQVVSGGKSGDPRGITSDGTATGSMLCLSCHNIHAAETNYDGNPASLAGLNQRPDQKTGQHGKLLVRDNFSSEAGSDLCRSCHYQNADIVDSRHDFSDLDLDSTKSAGVCSACHLPHGSTEKDRLWSRSLKEEREGFDQVEKPNYTLQPTLLCYDCHDDHYSVDDDPPLNHFLRSPQDIAFSDGPGTTSGIGFYETIPPGSIAGVKNPPNNGTETGGHYIKTADLKKNSYGINTGDKLPCNLCHNPHQVNNNEAFLRTPPDASPDTKFTASKNTRNGTGTGREICSSCHGYSELNQPINMPIRIFDSFFGFEVLTTPTQEQIELSAHLENSYNTACTDCHLHNRMAVPNSARSGPGTHVFHFKSLLANGKESIVSSRSLDNQKDSVRKCDICHSPDMHFQNGKLVFNDGKTFDQTTVCDVCHSLGGQYDGVNGRAKTISDSDYGAKDCWQNGVYETVTDESGTVEKKLQPGKEGWCIGCHDQEPSRIANEEIVEELWVKAPNINGDGETVGFYITGHGLSGDHSYNQSKRNGAGLLCTDCHSAAGLHIVNEKRDKWNNQNWQANGYRLKLPMVLPRTMEEYQSDDFALCFSCHNEDYVVGLPRGYRDYTDNDNPAVNYDNSQYPLARFRNADKRGIYPLRTMGQAIKIDFSVLFPNNTYNVHWNHLALPNADLPQEAVISPQAQQSTSVQRIQSCYSNRCHGSSDGTSGIGKLRPNSFWDSDRDGVLDSRASCTACHNPHGSGFVSMTRDDLGIIHSSSDNNWEYGTVTSKEYGAYTESLDNYNDLYCGDCHAYYQRSGSSMIYYPHTTEIDTLAPARPR